MLNGIHHIGYYVPGKIRIDFRSTICGEFARDGLMHGSQLGPRLLVFSNRIQAKVVFRLMDWRRFPLTTSGPTL